MTDNAWRFAQGGRIDRSEPLEFTFDGVRHRGFRGDTLASALLANGVRIVGRSFKLHRPRGLLGSWTEEPNAIVQIGSGARTVPNVKATQVELTDRLEARSVNCWPSASFDVHAPLQFLAPLLPAGFYYKTFKWPSWRWYEPWVRRMAGLGVAPSLPDPDIYQERYLSCDVLVVGGGPAGLAAALAAGRAGARVVLVEDRPVLGGSLQWDAPHIDGRECLSWLDATERELRALENVRVLTRCTAFGCYEHQLVALRELPPPAAAAPCRERLWHVRARQVVLATGAIERPIVFPDNDLPGIMLASAAMSYAVQLPCGLAGAPLQSRNRSAERQVLPCVPCVTTLAWWACALVAVTATAPHSPIRVLQGYGRSGPVAVARSNRSRSRNSPQTVAPGASRGSDSSVISYAFPAAGRRPSICIPSPGGSCGMHRILPHSCRRRLAPRHTVPALRPAACCQQNAWPTDLPSGGARRERRAPRVGAGRRRARTRSRQPE